MTRAVLLPTGADPFLLAYWLRHYKTFARYVHELHVGVCGPIPPEVEDYIAEQVAAVPHATLTRFAKRWPHGLVLTELLAKTSADHVMFIEDDGYIRRPTVVDESFRALEEGDTDLIGTPRDGYASEQLVAIAKRKFGDNMVGLAFWPTFLWVARENLEATDKVFDGTNWSAGDVFLGTHLTQPGSADTFVWASYQLRDQGLRCTLREAHHVGVEIPFDAPWFHVGSLSAGHGYLWQRDEPLTPEQRQAELGFWSRLSHGEVQKRLGWWRRMWNHWDGGIPEYHEEYGAGLRQLAFDVGVSEGDIDGATAHLDYLPTWAQ